MLSGKIAHSCKHGPPPGEGMHHQEVQWKGLAADPRQGRPEAGAAAGEAAPAAGGAPDASGGVSRRL